ncbi:dethiobiotin synthetase [Allochromatium warmingii]|uniref:ATP-dependent dethiobiotin synthetase BioD n=1 Tax=Allochromatium warmingii TaxID=61595 RepID=A0A1H3EZ04_ALLWA|nr:dethiobiotin synthase [Allochromatium warmingii]SDX83787.1 dethiobiotin synthetase [Allochromatium warmingii]
MNGLFITGTDTDCGKTAITLGLMAAVQARGERALGMKPVASGCALTPAGLRNADAEQLQALGSCARPYAQINPYAFQPPIAPHLAAEQVGVRIELAAIQAAYAELMPLADWVFVEGVGGWRVPLGPACAVPDIPRALKLPVLLVVGVKLGCLNHALLTVESIQASGCTLVGWIANQLTPNLLALTGNLETLQRLIPAPCWGIVPWLPEPEPQAIARYLHLQLARS